MSGSRKPNPMNDDHEELKHLQTPAGLQAIESQLGLLEPRADRLDRERLIFLAGQASVERPTKRWAWPASLAAMTALAATLLTILLTQPDAAPRELQTAEKSLAEIQQDFAHRHPKRQALQGITTATIYHEEELAALLYGRNTLVANADQEASDFDEELQHRLILTPSSWDQLLDESML